MGGRSKTSSQAVSAGTIMRRVPSLKMRTSEMDSPKATSLGSRSACVRLVRKSFVRTICTYILLVHTKGKRAFGFGAADLWILNSDFGLNPHRDFAHFAGPKQTSQPEPVESRPPVERTSATVVVSRDRDPTRKRAQKRGERLSSKVCSAIGSMVHLPAEFFLETGMLAEEPHPPGVPADPSALRSIARNSSRAGPQTERCQCPIGHGKLHAESTSRTE
jgi:hypothetical protein